ncbi:UNVERIFIED_CONTAM: hypothetical protein Slati_3710600 [Sesamum latifolium]|uniref:Uncharacterized protein n=1 Tax=Sesamum latifolium TaxID=2727402 RepID=A0AAW2U2Y5_9LAMI
MSVNIAPFKLKSTAKNNVSAKNNVAYEKPQRKLTLKEMQARQYPFLGFDVSRIFDDLLEANLIDLSEMKRPEEAERRDDPIYCKYHRLIGHAIQDCFVFKDKVMQLARQDLLLGSKPHNCPLFVAGYAREQTVNMILIDGGSAVNTLRTLKELGVPMDELSNSRLMIQDFNQGGQRAIGVIRMKLLMDDMCFKYCRNSTVKKVLGDSKPFTEAESHFADAKYYIDNAKKGKEVLPSEESKSHNSQSIRKNDSSTIEVELSKAGYNPKKKLSLRKLPPEATGKKLHGLNATQVMLKEKGYAIQDSRVGLGFTPPKPVRISIKRVSSNYIIEGFSSTEDDKEKENPRESVFNRLGPHRRASHGIANKQSVFDRLGPCKRMGYQKKDVFKVAAHSKKNTKSSHTQKLRSLIPSNMRHRTTLTISCGKVLKVKARIMIFTQVQYDEDDRKSVASSNYISNSDSSHDELYVVKEAYTSGAYRLVAEDGLRIDRTMESF